jgi:hypothetical protein
MRNRTRVYKMSIKPCLHWRGLYMKMPAILQYNISFLTYLGNKDHFYLLSRCPRWSSQVLMRVAVANGFPTDFANVNNPLRKIILR